MQWTAALAPPGSCGALSDEAVVAAGFRRRRSTYSAGASRRDAFTVRSASLPATVITICEASSGFFAAYTSASRSDAWTSPSIGEARALVGEAEFFGPGGEGRVRLGAADEDHIAMPQQIVRHFKILVDRHLAFVPVKEAGLHLLGGVAVRARLRARCHTR